MGSTKNTVWKFEVENIGIYQDNAIMLPENAEIVAFGYQEHPVTGADALFVWAVTNPDAPTVRRKFLAVPTGMKWVAKDLDHVMTCQIPNGEVWHLLEWRRA